MEVTHGSDEDLQTLIDSYSRMQDELSKLVGSEELAVAVEARRMSAIIEATLRQFGLITPPARRPS